MPLRLVACVLLLEITTFLRESYRALPKPHQQAKTRDYRFGGGLASAAAMVSGAQQWSDSRSQSRDQAPISLSLSGRRWSMAAQSLAGGQSLMSHGNMALTGNAAHSGGVTGGGGGGGGGGIPSCNSSEIAVTPTGNPSIDQPFASQRRISFVLQEDINLVANGHSTLTVQVRLHE